MIVLLKLNCSIWERSNTPISKEYKEIYQLLSGNVESETIGQRDGWLRAFATHVFLKSLPLDPLRNALSTYSEEAWREENAEKPLPWYAKVDYAPCSEEEVRVSSTSLGFDSFQANELYGLDMLYHILRLACDNMKYPLRKVLDTAGFSENPLNSGLAWHMNQVLRGLSIFGNGLSIVEESKLCMSYILELEVY